MAFQVTINMDEATANGLNASGYCLYGFRAVQCSDHAGMPLVWLQTSQYSTTTSVSWQDQLTAYTSLDSIVASNPVMANFNAAITLGQNLTVDKPTGIGVVGAGVPSMIGVLNQTTKPFTCGLSSPAGSQPPQPYCAFPLYGNNAVILKPLSKILLLFATNPMAPGTPVGIAFGSGLLVDLTSSSTRTVSYDLNASWSWGGYSWAQAVPPLTNLIPLLIEYEPNLEDLAVAAAARLAHSARDRAQLNESRS